MEKIVIRVKGGLVQEVWSSIADVNVFVIDEDCDSETYPEAVKWGEIEVPKYCVW
jgi:hypothetical protein